MKRPFKSYNLNVVVTEQREISTTNLYPLCEMRIMALSL